ncbi:type VI-B CRISPR-associated RNA-guided ribonuclease Cas13b [Dysgonomonas sp. Marseille-Q5470]|uniref:type VI-B CRISPR-associated RNA-guided ribonuclease Cas13b n=1 Tax=Dysgonomonas sp. Marseille-Q5470 TaxID=3039494 RepID=UPI0024BCA8D1|nr:type VI-B CRISPR-associated RNA-guided ribonuclease Cas13b [Dysgonomonas sp. Marseille-Q5470]
MERHTERVSVTYDYTNKTDKHYFAGFLNQADLNFRTALVELAKRSGIGHGVNRANEGKNDEDETISWINDSFNDKLSQTDWNYRTSLLSNFLPFVREISYKENVPVTRDIFRSELILLYESLMILRHYYTHMLHDEKDLDKKVFPVLDYLMLQAANTVRNRRLRNAIYKPAFPKQFEEDYKEAEKKFIKHNQEVEALRQAEKLKDGFDIKQFKKKHSTYKKEDFHSIYLNRAVSEILDKDKDTGGFSLKVSQRSERSEKDGKFSQNGFIFFLCLFLSRKDAEDLLDHTTNFKASYQLRYLVKRWTYTVFCYVGIRYTLRSEFSKEALLLQIVDELSQCPAELFDVLPEDKQQEFVMDRNEYFKDNDEDGNTPEESRVSHLIIRKRYQDRFPYFAIRFLDEFACFPSLRFQLRLGKYNHDTRTKTFRGIETTTERSIKEEIKVFGKLSEVHKAKQEYFATKSELDEKPIKGWLQYPNVSYVLDNNNIPIYLDKFTEKQNFPIDRTRKTEILNELKVNEIIRPDAPHAFLSINELAACIYLFMQEASKKKKHPNSEKELVANPIGVGIENRILGKVQSQYKFIQTVECNSPLSDKNAPKRFIRSLKENKTNGEIDYLKLENAIKRQIEDCDQRLIWLNSKKEEQKKREKKNLNTSKSSFILNSKEIGEIANWLAKDIKRYVSKADRKNWKGRHQAELQALLAFYDKKKLDIESFLKDEMGISISQYPPLEAIFQKTIFIDAYNSYLKKKKELLSSYVLLIKNNTGNYQQKAIRKEINKIFDHFDRSKYSYIDTAYHSNLLQKPVNLPRGLFDDKKEFSSKGNKEGRQTWFALAEDAPKQVFYRYPRAYRIKNIDENVVEMKEFNISENINDKADFDTELKKRIVTNEKRIRKIARQDYYLLQIVKFLFEELGIKFTEDVTLSDAFLERDNIQKNIQISYSQSQRDKGDCSENIYRISNLLERRIDIKLFGGEIPVTNIRLKDVGKYRALEKDERVRKLLSYSDRNYSRIEELIEEVDNYEYMRKHELFKAIHKLEDTIYAIAKENNETDKLLKEGNPHFKKYIEYYYSQKRIDFEKDNKDPLTIIRDRLSHNQLPGLPEYNIINAQLPRNETELIGDYLLRVFNSFNNSLISL